MPLQALLRNPALSVPRPSAILSRFTGPLANRSRNVSEFYVQSDDPWKSYFPGETVTGGVVLTVVKALPITHLVICLHGHARVYRNQITPGDGVAASGFLGQGRGSRGTEYLGNGFISLFEDEVVLCGEGLLKKGVYQFKFELKFPMERLPTSIDFERGNVSYFITATLTRPATIAPTISCDRRVLFQDLIDVGHTPVPKPRIVTLEPISKRDRVKAKVKQTSWDVVQEPTSPGSGVVKRTETEQRPPSNSSLVHQPPLSPAPSSDRSSAGAATTSSQSFQIVNHPPQTTDASPKNSETRSTSTSTSTKAITASIEILKPGVIPGDVVPLRISIAHRKPNVRGLIIVTLYRQGRVDIYPPIPLASRSKGKKAEYEDVYPRSKTGLGGLHFSNSSSSSVFRKDLCQSTAMMVVDPHMLTADVRASIKIPEDAFPTMTNVPGGMIEFKYYVEVVIDSCGMLGESRLLPRISLTTPPQNFTNFNGNDSGLQVTSNWTGNILDTAQLQRGKNIVVCRFEVTVGSKDSTRVSKKRHQATLTDSQRSSSASERDPAPVEERYYGENGYHDSQSNYDGWPANAEPWEDAQLPPPRFVPPPEPEEEVDEKTRIRRQEALLLPGQPPDHGGSSSAVEALVPSAPFIPEEASLYEAHGSHRCEGGPYVEHVAPSITSTRSVETIVPSYSYSHPPMVNGHHDEPPLDDKQELERHNLMTQAGGPPAGDDERAAGPSAPTDAPSAPLLAEEDEYNAHTLNHHHNVDDNLPQYRR